jgi:hypothetical protein
LASATAVPRSGDGIGGTPCATSLLVRAAIPASVRHFVLGVALLACSASPREDASSESGAVTLVPITNGPCGACAPDEICYRSGGSGTQRCVPNPDPCAKCTSGEICYRSGNTSPPTAYCLPNPDPCAKCTSEEICYRSGSASPPTAHCIPRPDPCAQCAPGQVCYRDGNTAPPTARCIPREPPAPRIADALRATR